MAKQVNCLYTYTHQLICPSQVIADLYEKYVELIGTTNEAGETMKDGYVVAVGGRGIRQIRIVDTDVNASNNLVRALTWPFVQ